jgi:copper chaperone CopZ
MSLEIVAGLLGSGLVRAVASEVATTLACQAISAAVTSMARPGSSTGTISPTVVEPVALQPAADPSGAAVLQPVPTVEVLSAIPGRARLRVHGLREDADRAAQVTAQVRALDGVTTAEANSLTGTLLVRFDARQTDVQAIIDALEPPVRARPLRASERAPYLRLVVG